MRIALAQFNATVGDITANTATIIDRIAAARDAGARLVVFPELAVFGYPPRDLVHRRALVTRNRRAVEQIAAACRGIHAAFGFVDVDTTNAGTGIFNALALCGDGRILTTYAKRLLPTYDVFDECRYFNPGARVGTYDIPGDDAPVRLGLTVCEDLWNDQQFEGRRVYGVDPIAETVAAGAQLLINISASPFRSGKQERRERLFADQVREHATPLVYVNLVGGNDDILFDGASLVFDAGGRVVARARAFEEDFCIVDLPLAASRTDREFEQSPPRRALVYPEACAITPYPDARESLRRALVLGTRDYVHKCGFTDVVIGLSGGIDSAVTAALAVDALGAAHVHGVAMPSRYSSTHSMEDARALAENLGIPVTTIPIQDIHHAFERTLAEPFAGLPANVTEENIQARIRGNLLMALSNKFGWMLLTTGNKSELAVGYCTLYGDMCGGLAMLSDVPKTTVYELARHINAIAGRTLIPQHTIDKPPSAELRENQTDQDTLPPYETLDPILEHYVERDRSVDEIVAVGFDRAVVERIACLVDRSEYKRKQAAVGLKVTSRAFGTGRRMPIAARF